MAIHTNTCRREASTVEAISSASSSSSCSSSATTPSHQLQWVPAVATELEQLRCFPLQHDGVQFPPACRALLLSLPGNHNCADCGAPRPEWASLSYGILLCVQCCGRHRSYGVQNSRVRSIDMDTWTHPQVLAMLEGGNTQLCQFFDRHQMTTMTCRRYRTKAALFYRTHLHKHVEDVAKIGIYEGREVTRRRVLLLNHNSNSHNNPQESPSSDDADADSASEISSTRERNLDQKQPVQEIVAN